MSAVLSQSCSRTVGDRGGAYIPCRRSAVAIVRWRHSPGSETFETYFCGEHAEAAEREDLDVEWHAP